MTRLCSTLLVIVTLLFSNSASFGETTMLAYGPPLVDPVGIATSPDGTTLFISDFWPDDAIFRLPVTGGTPTVIASGDSFGSIRGITISPDGSTLYITDIGATGAGAGVVFSLPATGGTPTILASGGPLVTPHGIATSPDGSTLFIADNWFYSPGIYSLPATGGDPTLLAAVPPYTNYGRAIDICVSPDGSTIFVAGGFCIYSLPSSGGALSVIPCSVPFTYATSITLSADGQTLFILDSGGIVSIGPTLIYSLPISGGTPTLVLSGPPLAAGGVMRLSRDSTKLYVADIGSIDCCGGGPVGEPGRVFVLSVVPSVTQPPIADAGDDIVADANEVVTLDGSGSSDPDGQIIKYAWKRLPDGVVIYSGPEPTCQTRALGRVEEVIELTVTDDSLATATDTLKIISRTTQQLKDQLAAMQSQIEQVQRQNHELRALVDKISSFPPIAQWLRRVVKLGDLNGDGQINMADFALLTKGWLR